jgi:hypothetical protein
LFSSFLRRLPVDASTEHRSTQFYYHLAPHTKYAQKPHLFFRGQPAVFINIFVNGFRGVEAVSNPPRVTAGEFLL